MKAPTCSRHDQDLAVVEEGWLNGVHVRYWRCPADGWRCSKQMRTTEPVGDHDQPALFDGGNR